MKYALPALAVTAVVLAGTACSSSHTHSAATHPVGPSRTAAGSSSTLASTAAGAAGIASPFCALARRIGLSDLGASSGNLDPDPHTLLAQVDQLDALAPSELKADFDVFRAFEHAVLDPGSGSSPSVAGNTTAALEHVSSYFTSTCGVH